MTSTRVTSRCPECGVPRHTPHAHGCPGLAALSRLMAADAQRMRENGGRTFTRDVSPADFGLAGTCGGLVGQVVVTQLFEGMRTRDRSGVVLMPADLAELTASERWIADGIADGTRS